MTVEVKIGVQYAAREIVVESSQTPEAVEELITAAVKAGGLLTLADERGRRVLIPAEQLVVPELCGRETGERRFVFEGGCHSGVVGEPLERHELGVGQHTKEVGDGVEVRRIGQQVDLRTLLILGTGLLAHDLRVVPYRACRKLGKRSHGRLNIAKGDRPDPRAALYLSSCTIPAPARRFGPQVGPF